MQITLDLPDNLAQLDQTVMIQEIAIALLQQNHITLDQAAQLINIPHSELQQLLNSRNLVVSQTPTPDPDDEPEELILNSIRTSLQQIREGRIHPVSELWDGIDA
ncbi:MAG: hypothetical protein HC881_06130 [Leptolyngbyaceae cyanobacterium SL_7_1]|nr:hypothetical protein [Leptolyngbyaceae cyanobacterium SL_7_1]